MLPSMHIGACWCGGSLCTLVYNFLRADLRAVNAGFGNVNAILFSGNYKIDIRNQQPIKFIELAIMCLNWGIGGLSRQGSYGAVTGHFLYYLRMDESGPQVPKSDVTALQKGGMPRGWPILTMTDRLAQKRDRSNENFKKACERLMECCDDISDKYDADFYLLVRRKGISR
ncbi:hypothetical protein EDB80DRAFT_675877 [Ilyonectria destructans]|nr:hypothetical protein EDB80DRAFT_675877 [Ilyonectria destructans]